jgi:ribose transport system ATP-binding protein
MKSYLEMKDISKKYPGVLALDEVDFDLNLGEVHALVGENGAGKSTLIKVLFGVIQKNQGAIWINGKNVEISSPEIAQKLGIIAIQQNFSLISTMTVAENIYYGDYFLKKMSLIDWDALFSEADIFLKSIGFDTIDVRKKINQLSVADCQKIEIAKAIRKKSKILIMDEPSAVLSKGDLDRLFKIIKNIISQNVAVIYISHHLDEVFDIADRITVLKDGKKVKTLLKDNTNHNELIQLMVGRKITEMYPKREVKVGKEILSIRNFNSDILKDVSFDLQEREVLGIAGLVGAGRTELCEAIFGCRPIQEGTVYINDKKVSIHNPLDAIKNGLGFLTEDRHRTGLILTLPLQSNISLVGYKKISNFGIINKRIDNKISHDFVNKLNIITPSINQIVQLLSGGNQQKVVLSKWLFNNPKILILDEPTWGVDVGAKVEIYKLINSLVKDGLSIIMVSSDLPEILGISNRVIVMREGRIVGEFLPKETTEEEIVACASGVSLLSDANNTNSMEQML